MKIVRCPKKYLILVGAAVAVAVGGIYVINRGDMNDPVKRYQAAMAADAAGGKTPAETLRMFVAALRAHDVARAASYFILDDNLSRAQWVDYFTELKRKNVLDRMADDIEKNARPGTPAYEGDYGFILRNKDGSIGLEIDMELNPLSGVWKLQSL